MIRMDAKSNVLDSKNNGTSNYEDFDLQQRAFNVTFDTDEDLSIPPMNGDQYLRRVIVEAQKYPTVIVANVDSQPQTCNQVPILPEKIECSSDFLMNKDLQALVMADFSQQRLNIVALRQKLSKKSHMMSPKRKLPKKEDDEEWLKIILPQGPHIEKCPMTPSTRFCLDISQVKLWHVLGHFSDWLRDGVIGIEDSCSWIYCLLACLELPVGSSVYFTLRQIARELINLRAQLVRPDSKELPHINLLICIIGRYFNQTDLADPFI